MSEHIFSVNKEFVESFNRVQDLARDSFIEMFGEEAGEHHSPIFAALSGIQMAADVCITFEDIKGYKFFRACTLEILNRTDEYFQNPKEAQ